MKAWLRKPWAVAIFLTLALLVGGCAAPPPAENNGFDIPKNGAVQSSDAGSVTIDVEWIGTGASFITFNVSMNTHSVELDDYDLEKLTIIRDDDGNEYLPLSWDSAPGGHHRQGTLTFTLPETLSQGTAKYLEMVINDVAGIAERVLIWQL